MSEKLISADDVLKYTVLAGEIRNPHMEVVPAYFLREAPAVDAVEVVRCRECFYHKDSCFAGEGKIYCNVHMKYFPKDGFCSSGERREE